MSYLKAQQRKVSAQFFSCNNSYQIFTMVIFKGLLVLAVSLTLLTNFVVAKSKNKMEPAASKANNVANETKTGTKTDAKTGTKSDAKSAIKTDAKTNITIPCTCGVFLTGQFTKGSNEQPKGDAVFIQEINKVFPCSTIGQKQCQTKCLEAVVGHLPNSANLLCATLGRDCRKERAYLFIKNCKDTWINTNLAAGKEYCCKDGQAYPCPLV